ncbi:CubicO group peptidase, beta-lactamase class C family [Chitinophaga costaii]|uniref:CubicO group peptidase, beta-lactamase class C family n=1 Tax=Chitinophaga costaii TaxID=1335309 RepID=A0A1C4AGR5_9BACT|nr:serine hydrolase domain-containing protein [Chitinophaga costaii]PUZ26597.1 serine hydrolase [Chitinophaga costaii]SCB93806.1 CubicO group peptidase, beta-lactamase class C family [Chitinophaga costaii]
MKNSLLLSGCLFLFTGLQAQDIQRSASDNPLITKLDSAVQAALQQFISDTGRQGVSAGIFLHGQTFIYNYCQGDAANLPNKYTLYEIGTISQTFTGALLAQAVLEHRIKWSDDIRKYLHGAYPNLAYQGHPIQVKFLLSQVSGLPYLLPAIPDQLTLPEDTAIARMTRSQQGYTKANFLRDLHQVTIDTVPGYRIRYSNTAAQLAGFLLEDIYHQSYDQLLKKYITTPLHMQRTVTVVHPGIPGLAVGYSQLGVATPYNPSTWTAAAGIYASVEDMVRYAHYQLNEKNPVISLTHQPVFGDSTTSNMGQYWQITKTESGCRKIWQSSATFGFSSYLVMYPEQEISIVLLSNESDHSTQQAQEAAAQEIYNAL